MSPEMTFWQYRISLTFLLLFLVVFLPLGNNKRRMVLWLAGCFLVTAVMDYAFFFWGEHKVPVFHTLAEIVVIQSVPFAIGKYKDFRSMFVGFTAAVYVLAGNIACSALYLAGAGLAVNLVCQCAIHSLLIAFLAWKIRDSFRESLKDSRIGWGPLCMIPALFYTAVYAVSVWPADLYRQPENLLGVCSILALMVISYIMIFQTFTRVKREGEQKRSISYLENYARRIKFEADLIQEKEREAAILRHDLRHYSLLIRSYLDEGQGDKVRELLGELDEQINETRTVRYCENLAVNGIVAHCAKQAEKEGLRFEADLEIPQKLRVNEFEFATVAANLLENAVNAASGAEEPFRFVKISARGVKGRLILGIENGCRQTLELSGRTGLPISEGGEGHGYGMQSVQAFARKNDALFDFEAEDHIFKVKILFEI